MYSRTRQTYSGKQRTRAGEEVNSKAQMGRRGEDGEDGEDGESEICGSVWIQTPIFQRGRDASIM